MNLMNSEISDTVLCVKNKSLNLVAGHECRFHKFLINDVERWCCTVVMDAFIGP